MQLQHSKFPIALFPNLSLSDLENSIQLYVTRQKFHLSHHFNTYEAISLDAKQANLLQTKRKTPTMKISSRGVLTNGKVFEASEIIALDYQCTYITAFNKRHHSSRIE